MLGTLGRVRRAALLIPVLAVAGIVATSARADGVSAATTASTTAQYPELAPGALPATCLGGGGILIAEPHGTVALDTPAASLGASGYPADGSIVTFAGASGAGAACTGSVSLTSVSLFGGAVTAASVSATAGHGSVSGLTVNGSAVNLAAGETAYVGDWAHLTLGVRLGRLIAPLELVLYHPMSTLPAGTVILIGYGEAPAPVVKHTKKKTATHASAPATSTTSGKPHSGSGSRSHATSKSSSSAPASPKKHHHHHKKKKKGPQPLTVTPPLGTIHYDFPVDGGASYVDTYGAGRSDIYDGWHHGDDLFAPLGTPIVAVARGTLSLVGWNELGGWRVWLTDKYGNSFYYAHLSGYSRWILHHRHVKAGEVIGFLGRTGDAFTTQPHLHFEVHPHQFLTLGYDGAVDPTAYLHSWNVVKVPQDEMPRPARLHAPAGAPAQEAAVVWHELLAARHLLPKAHPAKATSPKGPAFALRRPFPGETAKAATQELQVDGAVRVDAHVAPLPPTGGWPTAVGAAVLAVGGFAFFAVGRRRRWPAASPLRLVDLARAARRARAPR
jgi:murein DD-endopeptidase MepM/ murein hydrolase activator NlpD